ncbi:MAG: hypothetical protein SXA11_06905 [Cyanobacteriota bacterium]|nr:hypothetical protein [Cyanobacteriota bacterium]
MKNEIPEEIRTTVEDNLQDYKTCVSDFQSKISLLFDSVKTLQEESSDLQIEEIDNYLNECTNKLQRCKETFEVFKTPEYLILYRYGESAYTEAIVVMEVVTDWAKDYWEDAIKINSIEFDSIKRVADDEWEIEIVVEVNNESYPDGIDYGYGLRCYKNAAYDYDCHFESEG